MKGDWWSGVANDSRNDFAVKRSQVSFCANSEPDEWLQGLLICAPRRFYLARARQRTAA